MSNKLNAEELFESITRPKTGKPSPYFVNGFKWAVWKVAQPIADERDELREAIAELHDAALDAREYIAGKRSPNDTLVINLTDCTAKARAILAKYPKP